MLHIDPAEHARTRISLHPSQRQPHVTPVSQRLHVACAISNPERFAARHRHYAAFAKHMAESGVLLYTAELALRDRHHEIEQTTEHVLLRLRSESELWHKENLLNLAVARFDPDWHYGAVIDGDFLMTRPDWATEAIHQLQHVHWVQLFASYSDLAPDFTPYRTVRSFAHVLLADDPLPTCYYEGTPRKPPFGASGGAWAFRREAFDAVGGLMERHVVGGADWHMAFALAGRLDPELASEARPCTAAYKRSLARWAGRAARFRHSLGCLDNHALHFWHGPKARRKYLDRWRILVRHAFDPDVDVCRDWQGVLGWAGNKPALEEDVRRYFRSRDEDSTTFP